MTYSSTLFISGCCVLNLEGKSNNPLLSYRRFSTFLPCNFRGGARLIKGSQVCMDPTSPNLFQRSDISLCFQTRAAQNLIDVVNDAKFCTFWGRSKFSAEQLYE